MTCNAAIAGYVPGIRPYTSFNNGGYKPSETTEYYKLKKPQKQETVQEVPDKAEPILVEVKNPKMIAARKAIKAILLEDRIKTNDDYTKVMEEYNDAYRDWLSDNSEMISQGLLQDPGDATYYEPKLSEIDQCKKDGEKNCDYQYTKVDGEHSQQEIDDAASSRKYLAEQDRKEFATIFFIIASLGILGGGTLAFLSSITKK